MKGACTEEDLLKREIDTHPVVNNVSLNTTSGIRLGDYHSNLRCCVVFVYGNCTDGDRKLMQVGPVHMSRDRPTQLDCSRELHIRIQQHNVTKCVTVSQT